MVKNSQQNPLDVIVTDMYTICNDKTKEKTMVNNLIPSYADGYEIRYDRPSDTFRCFQNDARLKNNGKAFAPKSLARAKKFMAELGVKEVAKKPEVKLWTPPEPAKIAPLADQLASLPADAPRFVLIEAGYGTYKEQGYACYDREAQEIVCAHTYNGWNDITQDRDRAEAEVAYRNEHGPTESPEPDLYLFNAVFGEQIKESGDFQPKIQPGSEAAVTYERQKAYWHARKAEQPEEHAVAVKASSETTFVTERKYVVGETLVESDCTYTVIEESFYLSQRDVDDAEDGFDVFGLQAGWQTKARKA